MPDYGQAKCARVGCKVYFWPNRKGRPMRFCSNACKQAEYRAQKRLKEVDELVEKVKVYLGM